MKKTLLFLALLAVNLYSFGQIEKTEVNKLTIPIKTERTQLQTNTNFLIVGEFLKYKFFAFEGSKLSKISKVGYVELVGDNKNIISSQKIKLKNGSGKGDIFIPAKIRTGQYKLICYTNWSKNNSENSGTSKDIFIINPFSSNTQEVKNPKSEIELRKSIGLNKFINKNTDVNIKTAKRNYRNREAVNINVTVDDELKNGSYTLSIRKMDSIDIPEQKISNIPSNSSNIFFIPELRGELLTGKILNKKNSEDIEGKEVSFSIPGKNYVYKISKTNHKGQFLFNLKEYYNNKKGLLEIIGAGKENYIIKIDTKSFNNYDALSFNDLTLNPNLKHNIEQRNINSQIENSYYEKKQDSIIENKKESPFYCPLGKEYILDDYTRFKTVRNTFIEVINIAGMRTDGDSHHFLVYGSDALKTINSVEGLTPLILIDGMIIQNIEDFVDLDPARIEKITVYKNQYLYGPKLFQGIIDVSTFLLDFTPSGKGDYIQEIDLKQLVRSKKYHTPNYSDTQKNNRIPDYRRQLLWIPNVTFAKANEMSFKTYSSDNIGTYEIKLEGYNTNGKYIKATNYFTVK